MAILFAALCWMMNLVTVRIIDLTDNTLLQAGLAGLIFAQLGLLTAWLAFDPRELATKSVVTVCAAAILAQPLANYTPFTDSLWWGMFVAFGVLVLAGCTLLRIASQRAEHTSAAGTSQFSISGILSLTTATAVALAAARAIEIPGWRSLTLGTALALSFVGCCVLRNIAWPRAVRALVFVATQSVATLIVNRLGLTVAHSLFSVTALSGLTLLAIGIERCALSVAVPVGGNRSMQTNRSVKQA